LLLKQPFLRI